MQEIKQNWYKVCKYELLVELRHGKEEWKRRKQGEVTCEE